MLTEFSFFSFIALFDMQTQNTTSLARRRGKKDKTYCSERERVTLRLVTHRGETQVTAPPATPTPRRSGCLRQTGEQINHSRTSHQGWTQMRLCVLDNQMAAWMLSLFVARASADIRGLRQRTQTHPGRFIRECLMQCNWLIA